MLRESSSRLNVGQGERGASLIGGGVLLFNALRKSSLANLMMGIAGAELLYRGATGHCPVYQALKVNTAGYMGIKINKSVTVNAQPEDVYRFWRDFENLPRFMKHVTSVHKLDDKRSHWVITDMSGLKRLEWQAQIINEKENELIAWMSMPGSDIYVNGSVHFRPAMEGRGTVVTAIIGYEAPAGLPGSAVARIFNKATAQQIKEDLRRFKEYIETGEIATVMNQPSGKQRDGMRKTTSRSVDTVLEAGEESFPASDAPAFTETKL
jgi:uncharacterized membrane protein